MSWPMPESGLCRTLNEWRSSTTMGNEVRLRRLPRVRKPTCVRSAHFKRSVPRGGPCFMFETNIRIVRPGPDLYLWIRRAAIQGPNLSVDLLQRACGTLRHRQRLAAAPCGGAQPSLLVATNAPIPVMYLEQENWVLEVRDAGGASRRLSLTDPDGASLIPPLIERTLLRPLANNLTLTVA